MNRGHRFLKYTLLVINLIVVISLVISYLAALIDPRQAWIIAFFGLAYPVILLLNLFFILVWLIFWKRYIFISLITILLGWRQLQSLLPLKLNSKAPPAGIPIKILTFNVHQLYGNDENVKSPQTRSEVTEFFAGQNADIVFIQEFYARGEDSRQTIEKFKKSIHLEYHAYSNYGGGEQKNKINAIAIFSKFPVIGTGHFKLSNGSMFAVFADVVMNNDTVRLYNLHLESIRFGREDYKFYSHLTEPDNEIDNIQLKDGSMRMLWKLRKAFILRSEQVELLKMHLRECRYPVILGGDFNDTPSSYTYNQLTNNLTDSFKESGRRIFESTYAGKFPSFRIDYIMYSASFCSAAYKKFDIVLSDHYPVSSTLIFKAK